MTEGTLTRIGGQMQSKKSTVLKTPWLTGDDGEVTLGVTGQDDNLPESGVVEATSVRIAEDETHSIGDMLAIFATDEIVIKRGATIDGHGNCSADTSVYGEGGKFDSEMWLHYAYQRILGERLLALNVSFEHDLCGGGKVGSNGGGSALLLVAPTVEIQQPVDIDLRGEGTASDGHFGVMYEDKFIYEGNVETNAHQHKYLPEEDTPRVIDS